ncbi:hypothetical protein [Methylocella sp.]|uniref:hypothetical protein n=1 Tax=Methylocella sp. TaxID=1978226 RepID=UPI003782E35A
MRRHIILLLAAAALAPAFASACRAQSGPPAAAPAGDDRLLNRDYLTPTGETVPKPGEPQSSGVTPLEKSIQKQDKKIENSICSNC